MNRDFGTAFITQCAPVMAGLKPANLFRWVEPDTRAMYRTIQEWRADLNPRGVRIDVLKACSIPRRFSSTFIGKIVCGNCWPARKSVPTCKRQVTRKGICGRSWTIFPPSVYRS